MNLSPTSKSVKQERKPSILGSVGVKYSPKKYLKLCHMLHQELENSYNSFFGVEFE